jgi:hypothetical protein
VSTTHPEIYGEESDEADGTIKIKKMNFWLRYGLSPRASSLLVSYEFTDSLPKPRDIAHTDPHVEFLEWFW